MSATNGNGGNGNGRAEYDVLVVGSGIGGMESALKLGAMGYRVLVVEKEPIVGGKMILLSKVFPTLDCASCISTPKMAATTHHPNLTVLTDSEVEGILRDDGGRFTVKIKQKPRFVDTSLCTGCRQCETACTVSVPDQFNGELVARRAAYIPFPQAVPQKALVERAGTSPCSYACPAGIKAHGYVSLVRSGEYEKAFQLVLETTPLIGSLGRACYAPCEESCTRGDLEGALPIRRIKRFVGDMHDATGDGPGRRARRADGKSVAIVGSGPAGLTAAWQLRPQGLPREDLRGGAGAGRRAPPLDPELPPPRRGRRARRRERHRDRRRDRDEPARRGPRRAEAAGGFDAVLARHRDARRRPDSASPARSSTASRRRSTSCAAVKLDEAPDLAGKTVAVIGGGNVAIDAARSVRRLGAAAVHQISLESRRGAARARLRGRRGARRGRRSCTTRGASAASAASGGVSAVELKRCTAVFDADGRFSPAYDEGETDELACDAVIVAIGMRRERPVEADPVTLQTAEPWLFAAGDVVSGPTLITTAVGSGRRAAFMIDRFLQRREPHRAAVRRAAAGRRARRRARAPAQPQPPRAARRRPRCSPARRPTSPSSSRA